MLLLMASSLTAFVPTPSAFTVDIRPPAVHPAEERRQQQRIAEITELIHVASLLHDDVIDNAETRRGLKALNHVFGNKIAILAGDAPSLQVHACLECMAELSSLQDPGDI